MIKINKYFILLPLFLSTAIFVKVIFLVDGFILNNYPLLSSDSFDYIVESEAIYKFFTDGKFEKLPVLRNPFFQ